MPQALCEQEGGLEAEPEGRHEGGLQHPAPHHTAATKGESLLSRGGQNLGHICMHTSVR